MKWVKIPYNDFDQFTSSQELLISKGEVDYLEGFISFSSNSSNNNSAGSEPQYTIEFALYYNDEGIVQRVTLHSFLNVNKFPVSAA